ncbi:hypothetical protein [Cupriavidus sp. WS]|uniref:Acb2/Tad1 domain-containing protein n=1 Tax=Cupriavidus sp. WS TaxID=1312922 RepID=UPI000372CEA2|nr:hypothetical protein [Cupriavidus sp. WS]
MDNQHRRIAGYRELSQEEIDLMNRIKAKGAELLALQRELSERLEGDSAAKRRAACQASDEWVARRIGQSSVCGCAGCVELSRFRAAESLRWAAIAKTDIETGVMALVRAAAQPAPL